MPTRVGSPPPAKGAVTAMTEKMTRAVMQPRVCHAATAWAHALRRRGIAATGWTELVTNRILRIGPVDNPQAVIPFYLGGPCFPCRRSFSSLERGFPGGAGVGEAGLAAAVWAGLAAGARLDGVAI